MIIPGNFHLSVDFSGDEHSSGNGGGGQTRNNCSPIVSRANDGSMDDLGSRNEAIKQESLNLQQGNSQQNENDQMSASNAQQTCHGGTKVFPPPPLPPSVSGIRGSQFSPFSDTNASAGHHRDANNAKSSASSNVLQGSAVSVMANQLKEIAPSNHLQSLVDQNNLVSFLRPSVGCLIYFKLACFPKKTCFPSIAFWHIRWVQKPLTLIINSQSY